MGCDYYILKVLRIYYNKNNYHYFSIELNRQKCYYNYDYDEDEEDYEPKVNNYIKTCLIPLMKPIIIYNNDKFNKSMYETKYKSMIENEMNNHGKIWSDIIKIIKVESRFERH